MKTNFMVFIAGDNNLDRAGQRDIQEMLAVEETGDHLNIIVQYDQSKHAKNSTTKRYVIQDGKKIVDIDIGETDTGDVNTLSEFLTWGIGDYPADRNIVILWNHGGGASDDLPQYYNNLDRSIKRVKISSDFGVSMPIVYGHSHISMDPGRPNPTVHVGHIQPVSLNPGLGGQAPSILPPKFRLRRINKLVEEYQKERGAFKENLTEAQTRSILLDDESHDFIDNLELKEIFAKDNRKIDIIGFDACLMNMMEVAYQLKDHAEMLVGSQENEPEQGWDYKAILSYIVANPKASNEEISNKIIESYMESCKHLNNRRLTLSTIRTDKLNRIASAMNDFAYAILENEPKIFKTLRNIVDDVESFNGDDDLYFDFYHFVSLTKAYYEEEDNYQENIVNASDDLLREIKRLILKSESVKVDNAHGVSVYLGTNAKMSPFALSIFSKLDINTEEGAPYWFELFQMMSKRLSKEKLKQQI